MKDRFSDLKSSHEVLSEVVDEFVENRRAALEKRGVKTSKLAIKTELGRAIGLGNGGDDSNALKGLYRLLSGETPLSVDRALLLCLYMDDVALIQWVGWRAGIIMTPRAAIEDPDATENEDVTDRILECLRDCSSFVEALSGAYSSKPSPESINKIEGAHLKASLSMERCRLVLRSLIEAKIDCGSREKP